MGSVYLAKTKLYKTLVGSGSANPLRWMYYAYTGTMGRDQLTIPLDDYLSYQISAMTFTDPDSSEKVDLKSLPEAEQERIKMVMEQLVERHMTYSNIKLYYTDALPARLRRRSQQPGPALGPGQLHCFRRHGDHRRPGHGGGTQGPDPGATPEGEKLTWTGSGDRSGITLTLTGRAPHP